MDSSGGNIESVVYVVVLNWNGWKDTLPCLESLLASQDVSIRIVVCDNASADGSLDHVEAWAAGDLPASISAHPRLSCLSRTEKQPVSFVRIDRSSAEAGNGAGDAQVVLIDNGANLGFAAGSNVGLRFALAQQDMTHVWVLNNDTLVEPDCLKMMLRRLQCEAKPAVCGSMIHFFDQPELLQAVGGNRFNRVTGSAACSEGRFTHEDSGLDLASIEGDLAYLSGCSLLLPRAFMESVGLMCEDYFLYYEEIDWFTRAAGQFTLCIAADACLYHKEGASIGSASSRGAASAVAEFHMFRSRLIFMRKHNAVYLWVCYLHSWSAVLMRLLRGEFRNARTVAAVLLGKRSYAV
ncbi:MAG: GT2 family glycosyltransferase [Halioglobus sp.]